MTLNILDYQVQVGLTDEIAEGYLAAEVFAFDIETDTNSYHWEKTHHRGLSYLADPIIVSFYAEGLPPLVLVAAFEQQPYEAEVYDERDNVYRVQDTLVAWKEIKGKKKEPSTWQWVETPLERLFFRFSDAEEEFIRAMFERETEYTCIAHNFSFDARQLWGKLGITPNEEAICHDTEVIELLQAQLIPHVIPGKNEPKFDSSLYDLTARDLAPDTKTWYHKMKAHREHLHDVLTSDVYRTKHELTAEDAILYAAFDSIVALHLYNLQMDDSNTDRWYPRLNEMYDDFPTLLAWERAYTKETALWGATGIEFNVRYARELRDEYHQRYSELILDLVGDIRERELTNKKEWVFNNVLSPLLEKVEFTKEQILAHNLKSSKTGAWAFHKEAVEFYLKASQGYDIPAIEKYREASYLNARIKRLNEYLRHAEYDGRLHSQLSRMALTGRNRSSSPNLQNLNFDLFAGMLTSDTEESALVEIDLSNAEMWMRACVTAESRLAAVCCEEDYHAAMMPVWGVSKRSVSKTLNFAAGYGAGARKITATINDNIFVSGGVEFVTEDDVKNMLDNKRRAFPQDTESVNRASKWANHYGYTYLWSGRKANVQRVLKNDRYEVKGYAAINLLCQGGISEVIMRAIVVINQELRAKGYRSRVVLQIHDSLIVDLFQGEDEEVGHFVIETLATIVPDVWLNRTTPRIRFLTDIDHYNNSKKWGYHPYRHYPFDVNTYQNRWDTFTFSQDEWVEKDKTYKPRVWINEFGWGKPALAKELGLPSPEPEETEEEDETLAQKEPEPPFTWADLAVTYRGSQTLFSPTTFKGRYFLFEEAITLHRELCHRGQENEYLRYISELDKLRDIMVKYSEWRDKGGGTC